MRNGTIFLPFGRPSKRSVFASPSFHYIAAPNPLHPLQIVSHSEHSPGKVDIGPLQPETFAHAQPEPGSSSKQGFEPMAARRLNQLAGFGRGVYVQHALFDFGWVCQLSRIAVEPAVFDGLVQRRAQSAPQVFHRPRR
jgi:hypothetical protein